VTSRRGNQLGMAGMAIAVLTTLFGSPPDDCDRLVPADPGAALGAASARSSRGASR
jgi:NAD/NADP transhydrogenase beta subunit